MENDYSITMNVGAGSDYANLNYWHCKCGHDIEGLPQKRQWEIDYAAPYKSPGSQRFYIGGEYYTLCIYAEPPSGEFACYINRGWQDSGIDYLQCPICDTVFEGMASGNHLIFEKAKGAGDDSHIRVEENIP